MTDIKIYRVTEKTCLYDIHIYRLMMNCDNIPLVQRYFYKKPAILALFREISFWWGRWDLNPTPSGDFSHNPLLFSLFRACECPQLTGDFILNSFLSISSLSVLSHVKSGSSRPKWPNTAVFAYIGLSKSK